jgi:hypothetical protein
MDLLTRAIIELVNQRAAQDCFGMSVVGLPDFDYQELVMGISTSKLLELYFLGFGQDNVHSLQTQLTDTEKYRFFYTVEEAEESRNIGAENICRLLIVKNQELEKLSSLRWYETIDMKQVYHRSCVLVEKDLKTSTTSNGAIENLLKALKRKDIIGLLNFERVLGYLSALLSAEPTALPNEVVDNLYMLGLCHERDFCAGTCSVDDFRAKIKNNFELVRRLLKLEQKERGNIATFSAKNPGNLLVDAILEYYHTVDERLLQNMEKSELEEILKSVKRDSTKKTHTNSQREGGASPTVGGAQLVFDNNDAIISDVLISAKEEIDEREDADKSATVQIQAGEVKLRVQVEPVTEALAERGVERILYGGLLFAEVTNPKDALEDFDKYDCTEWDKKYIEEIRTLLERAHELCPQETVYVAFQRFLTARAAISQYSKRLQDMPMLQVINSYESFKKYLLAYKALLSAIKDDYSALSSLDSDAIRDVISRVIALDTLFIIGQENSHAIPMPCNPLYLWKYIKLAEEMLESRAHSEGNECYLSDSDKEFVLRRAESIPDPLNLIMLPRDLTNAECLPLAGRIGCIPVYSTKPQINDSSTGMELVKQGVIRYMCLYPHSSMMLRACFVNPPSVEAVIGMLKSLDKDKEFSAFGSVGIDLTIFRTKEASASWVELEDKSLNDGMLVRVRGKRNGSFNLSIENKELSYDEIIKRLSREQHLIVIFDPNEKKIEAARNNQNIHIHPLCVPKVYEYKKLTERVNIRPANEGELFADYTSIVEKLYNQPSAFGRRNVFDNSPITEATYKQLLNKTDWLMLLDQSLKSWDICLRSTSEKLYYKGYDYRSAGIYSKNSKKFVMGYKEIIRSCGNYVPTDKGVQDIITAIRAINEDGLLSIVSHSTNRIFDQRHGKGSLGLAIAAIKYKAQCPNSILVGLDTQLAREWLSAREDGKLPDLVRLRFDDEYVPTVDIIEVKTYDGVSAYVVKGNTISGHAVEQAAVLETLIKEIFGSAERLTTVSRREILREQVFEAVFCSDYEPNKKEELSDWLNKLFAGWYSVNTNKIICHIDFEATDSECRAYDGVEEFQGLKFTLDKIGHSEIQQIFTANFSVPANPSMTTEAAVAKISQVESAETGAEFELNVGFSQAVPFQSSKEPTAPDTKHMFEANPSQTTMPTEPKNAELDEDLKEKCVRLNMVLKNYGIKAESVKAELIQEAVRFHHFKIMLQPGETINNLKKKREDIARELEAVGEVFIDNIKGTRYVGLDVPFADSVKPISLLDNLCRLSEAKGSKGSLEILVGQQPNGEYQTLDLARAPHMLIAGTTGSGKTIFLYSIIVSLLSQMSSDELELLIIDPKQTDFHFFESLPCLRGNRVLVEAEEALAALETINIKDKEERTRLIRAANSRDIDSYNAKNPEQRMKRLVVVIDEYADLVQAAELQGKEVRKTFEANLCMLAQRVRNLGIHLVIATQQPRATIVTSSLKAVLPFRVSFRLPSHVDSQTILDRSGAEDLLGKGDMLMQTDSDLFHLQGFYISEEDLIAFLDERR